jgi:hypothetical protein
MSKRLKHHENGVRVIGETGEAFHFAATSDEARRRFDELITTVATGARVELIECGQVVAAARADLRRTIRGQASLDH